MYPQEIDLPDPPPKRSVRTKVLVVAAIIGAFGVGAIAGSAGAGEPVVRTNTVTVTASPPPPEVQTITTPVVPPSCLKVIALAGKGFGVAGKYPPLVADAFKAGLNQDTGAAQQVIDTMGSLNDQLYDLLGPVRRSAAACKAAT